MNTLKITSTFHADVTLITNDFIDHHMIQANGEFVKVYLFLLRHQNDTSFHLTVSNIADCLNNTENDILRAFRYWESEGLLTLIKDSSNAVKAIELTPFSKPASTKKGAVPPSKDPVLPSKKTVEKTTTSRSSDSKKELKSVLFIAEQYLNKTLTLTDIESITYFYEHLHMSVDLIEYLIESCVEAGHKSMHYIQKVALSWAESGITTKEQARKQSSLYHKNCYTVLKAFGIKNRGPAFSELAFIEKWTEEWGFSLDIIVEACNRTITATHQPSFEYTDSILSKWHAGQVHHLKDIKTLDDAYQKQKSVPNASAPNVPKVSTTNHNNFKRRSYDMDALEEQLLNRN